MPQPIASSTRGTLAVDPSTGEADTLLARVVRGKSAHWPAEWRGAVARSTLLERIDFHGVSGLLIGESEAIGSWPADLRYALRDRAKAATVWELGHRLLLAELTERLASADVDSLLLKGSALAYSLYSQPATRERGDTDLLVRSGDRGAARAVLEGLGFRRLDGNLWPEPQRFQEVWARTSDDGTRHLIDLHFDLLNSPALAGLLPFDRCSRGRRALPGIGGQAFAPARAVLLFHACIHRETNRVARYFVRGRETTGADRLIWLIDIDLLAKAMGEGEWTDFVTLAESGHQAKACLAGLDAASHWLETDVPPTVRSALRGALHLSSTYLSGGPIVRAFADVAAVRGVSARFNYARARLFPNQPGQLRRRLRRLTLREPEAGPR